MERSYVSKALAGCCHLCLRTSVEYVSGLRIRALYGVCSLKEGEHEPLLIREGLYSLCAVAQKEMCLAD